MSEAKKRKCLPGSLLNSMWEGFHNCLCSDSGKGSEGSLYSDAGKGFLSCLCNSGKRRSFRKIRKSASMWLMIAALILSCVGLTGCGAAQEPAPDDGRLKIVTTIFPPYDFARAIAGGGSKAGGNKAGETGALAGETGGKAGDTGTEAAGTEAEETGSMTGETGTTAVEAGTDSLADITMLLSPGEEVHSYEPTPLDIKRIQESDLFIYVGGENDVWVDRILENMGENKPETLRLVDLTDTVAEEIVEGMMEERGAHGHSHDHEEGADHDHISHTHSGDSSEEEHEEADEHVWTSPVKAAEIAAAIAEKMAELDPDNAAEYEANAQAYIEKILALDEQFRKIADKAERRTIVFGDRFPVRYFAEEYGLQYFAAFPGCSSEAEPSASTLAFLIDKVRKEQIPVVFSIEFSNGNIARAICESSGAVPRTFYSCHNVTKEQMEGGATYVSLMTENLGALREALGER